MVKDSKMIRDKGMERIPNGLTKTINWLSGNSDEFFTGSSYAITANGAVGYWDSWRTANSSASASSTGDEKIWNEYFVFTFIRNPLDRLYSQYRYRNFLYKYDFEYAVKNMKELYEKHYNFKVDENKTGDLQTILDHYGEWIHLPSQKEFLQGKYSNQIDKRPYIDFYGKCETLQQDFDYVCEKVGLPKTKLPHTNKSANPKLNVRKISYEY